MSTAASFGKRTSTRIAMGVGLTLVAFLAIPIWSKHDFCQGWANHFAARAEQLRTEAANPALGREEKQEHLVAAALQDIVSHKYAAVARKPWRPYPGHPLVTAEERRIAEGKH